MKIMKLKIEKQDFDLIIKTCSRLMEWPNFKSENDEFELKIEGIGIDLYRIDISVTGSFETEYENETNYSHVTNFNMRTPDIIIWLDGEEIVYECEAKEYNNFYISLENLIKSNING